MKGSDGIQLYIAISYLLYSASVYRANDELPVHQYEDPVLCFVIGFRRFNCYFDCQYAMGKGLGTLYAFGCGGLTLQMFFF